MNKITKYGNFEPSNIIKYFYWRKNLKKALVWPIFNISFFLHSIQANKTYLQFISPKFLFFITFVSRVF